MARPSRLPAEALAPLLVPAPHPRSPAWRVESQTPLRLEWPTLFGNANPVEIEVGFGKGMFLQSSAQARPNTNFLGIEIERTYVMLTAARLVKRSIANVRLVCTDARWLFKECVAAETVQAVHVYFPDPWWKQRHQKRKLLTPEFTEQCARVLTPGGVLHFVSDVEEYFLQSCAIIEGQGLLKREAAAPAAEDFLTNFERKYRLEGRPIYRTRFQKTAN